MTKQPRHHESPTGIPRPIPATAGNHRTLAPYRIAGRVSLGTTYHAALTNRLNQPRYERAIWREELRRADRLDAHHRQQHRPNLRHTRTLYRSRR